MRDETAKVCEPKLPDELWGLWSEKYGDLSFFGLAIQAYESVGAISSEMLPGWEPVLIGVNPAIRGERDALRAENERLKAQLQWLDRYLATWMVCPVCKRDDGFEVSSGIVGIDTGDYIECPDCRAELEIDQMELSLDVKFCFDEEDEDDD